MSRSRMLYRPAVTSAEFVQNGRPMPRLQRWLLMFAAVSALAGCADHAGDDGPRRPTCREGRLSFIHDVDGDGNDTVGGAPVESHELIDVAADESGSLTLWGSGGGMLARIEFEQPAADGSTVPARGRVTLTTPSLDVGNCETDALSGSLTVHEDGAGWEFVLTDLRAPPYCEEAPYPGHFAGCYQAPR
jgi:hypothetical protein